MYPEDTETEEDIIGGLDLENAPWYFKLFLVFVILIPVGLLGFIVWGIYKIITLI